MTEKNVQIAGSPVLDSQEKPDAFDQYLDMYNFVAGLEAELKSAKEVKEDAKQELIADYDSKGMTSMARHGVNISWTKRSFGKVTDFDALLSRITEAEDVLVRVDINASFLKDVLDDPDELAAFHDGLINAISSYFESASLGEVLEDIPEIDVYPALPTSVENEIFERSFKKEFINNTARDSMNESVKAHKPLQECLPPGLEFVTVDVLTVRKKDQKIDPLDKELG